LIAYRFEWAAKDDFSLTKGYQIIAADILIGLLLFAVSSRLTKRVFCAGLGT
jgi:hypothetical protein